MANVAETLRALSLDVAEDISELRQPAYNEELRERVAACESGAAAWEIVKRLAEMQPTAGPGCFFCFRLVKYGDEDHKPDCLWQQARFLVTGQEER